MAYPHQRPEVAAQSLMADRYAAEGVMASGLNQTAAPSFFDEMAQRFEILSQLLAQTDMILGDTRTKAFGPAWEGDAAAKSQGSSSPIGLTTAAIEAVDHMIGRARSLHEHAVTLQQRL